MRLPTMFHWAPAARREAILREGLKPYAPTPAEGENPENGNAIVGWPWVCVAPEPSRAWGLSGGMGWAEGDWDLWEVRLSEHDEVHIRPEFGDAIKEIRVHNAIPADRVWFVGTRTPPSAKEEPGDASN